MFLTKASGGSITAPGGDATGSSTVQSQDGVHGAALPGWFESAAWRGVIIVLCALWASNFAAAKLVMAEPGVDSSLYALSRFGVAACALAPFAIASSKRANMDWITLKQALICGSWVAFGYLGQTVGLLTTTASKSCVICSMHCVLVAAIAELWRVQKANEENLSTKFDLKRLLPALIAVAGVAIVELKGAGGAPSVGDALSFAQPVGFGMGYLLLENLMDKKPEAALAVSAIKLTVVAAASFLMFEISPLLHGTNDLSFAMPDFAPILSSPMALGGILYTGLVTTALALWVESIAFAKVPATDASLILTTEPLFAAGCGALALGETFGVSDYVGAGMIIGACVLSIFMDDPHTTQAADPAPVHPILDP
jgi:drug/metabolite transporter (DMT)-like permease